MSIFSTEARAVASKLNSDGCFARLSSLIEEAENKILLATNALTKAKGTRRADLCITKLDYGGTAEQVKDVQDLLKDFHKRLKYQANCLAVDAANDIRSDVAEGLYKASNELTALALAAAYDLRSIAHFIQHNPLDYPEAEKNHGND